MTSSSHYDLQSLRLFIVVAELGSLTKAAERTCMTLSAVSKRMADLEERIAKAQVSVQGRFAAYENRIAELEKQLATVEEEKRELIRVNFQLAKKALEAESAPQSRSSRVSLRDAGFLLRA